VVDGEPGSVKTAVRYDQLRRIYITNPNNDCIEPFLKLATSKLEL